MLSRRFYLHALLAAALMALVLWRAKFWDLPDAFRQLDWPVALAALAINVPVVALWAARSYLVLRKLGHRLPLGSLLLLSTLGNVAGTLTPAGAGDLLRVTPLRERHDVTTTSALSAVLYERMYVPALLILAVGVAATIELLSGPLWMTPVLLLFGVAAAVAGGSLYAAGSSLVRTLTPAPWREGLARRGWGWLDSAGEVHGTLGVLFGDMRLNLCFSTITGLVYSLTALQVWLVIEGVGGDVSLMEAWVAFGGASLAGMLVMLPAGLGVWDATLPAILSSRGVDLLAATAGALLVRAFQTLPLGLLAVGCYLLLARQGRRASARGEAGRAALPEQPG